MTLLPSIGSIINKCKITKCLPEGSGGIVFVANDLESNTEIVIKLIQLGSKSSDSRIKNKKIIEKEIRIGMVVAKECLYLISYLDVFEWGDFFCIKMEYCSFGDIQNKLDKGKIFTEEEMLQFIYEMAQALFTLEKNGIIHRDIKTRNIFITAQGSFKLGDYSIARITGVTVTSLGGTEGYIAPEILEDEDFSYPADIYSVGIVGYQMMSGGKHPFAGSKGGVNISKVMAGKFNQLDSNKYSNELKNLIYQMICLKPNERPTPSQLLLSHLPTTKHFSSVDRSKQQQQESEIIGMKEEIRKLENENVQLLSKVQQLELKIEELESKKKEPKLGLFPNPFNDNKYLVKEDGLSVKFKNFRTGNKDLVIPINKLISSGIWELKIAFYNLHNGCSMGVVNENISGDELVGVLGSKKGEFGLGFSSTWVNLYFEGIVGYCSSGLSNWRCKDGEIITAELNLSLFHRTLHFWIGRQQIPYRITLPNLGNFYFAFSLDSGHETKFISLKQLSFPISEVKPEVPVSQQSDLVF